MLIRICIFYPELETSGSALRRLQSAMRKRHQQLIASLLMGMFCMTTSWAAVVPRDVAAFVEQLTSCEHFSGEDAYDVQRARFLRSQI